MREFKRVYDTSACISDSLLLLVDSVSGDSLGTTAYHLQLRLKNAKIVCENIKILTCKTKSKVAGIPDPHFEIWHYDGVVGYNVTDWLQKNKDPFNNSVVALFKASELPTLRELWASYISADEATKSGGG